MIIAVDGPAGSGKSTISKEIADDLELLYIDTGAMYRLFTLKVLQEKIAFNDIERIKELLENLNMEIKEDGFYLDNKNVSEEIRSPNVTANVSEVSAIKEVREKMINLQRKISKNQNVILDGRDIGTVVFPNADLKIFLTADSHERAERRYKELKEKGKKVFLNKIYEEILERDRCDSNRNISPLVRAADAIEVNTTGKTVKEVKKEILTIYKNKIK